MKKAVFVLVLLAVSTTAFAQAQYEGSAKFVCGKADAVSVGAWAFAPGYYYTTINVTNPDDQITIDGKKRFSVALLRQKVGPHTDYVGWGLKAGESMQVDCSDIYGYLGIAPGTFIDGFVHFIGAPVRYDVTAVYTVSNGQIIINQDVEEVTVR